MSEDGSLTSVSLLGRVSSGATRDQGAWSDFVDRYAPKVYAWCRAWGLQEADAQDVTQAVLLKLALQMDRFQYQAGGSFRGWLWTLARNAWLDWKTERGRRTTAPADAAEQLDRLEARDDLARRLEREFDLELLEEATRRVRARVAASTWEAYRLTAVEGEPAAAVSGRLGLSVDAVFKARSSVVQRLKAEVRVLEGADPADPDE